MAKQTKEWQGAFNAFGEAYNQIMKNPQPMMLFVGVYTVLTILSLLIQGKSTINEEKYMDYASLIMLLFVLPLTVYGLNLARNKMLTVSDFMQIDFKKLLMVWVISLLTGLIIIGSIVLLIFPVIWTLAWFALGVYALVDKNLDPVEALKESKRITQNHKGKVWGIIGVSILVSIGAGIISVIPYIGVVGIAFATVLTTAASARLYEYLK